MRPRSFRAQRWLSPRTCPRWSRFCGALREPRWAEAVSPDAVPLDGPDLEDVNGQATPRLAVEVAAAGGHHLLLHGAPGAGKSLLAERLPSLLPPLTEQQVLEVTAVHSVAGALRPERPMVVRPPFQAPHHTASAAALVGGGVGVARPGAVSLAHRGVLFLDEAPEFSRAVLDTLRQPMERGEVELARGDATVTYPARFQLVLAANPCPCGRGGGRGLDCVCTPDQKRRYAARMSGPLLDRVDLQVPVLPVTRAELVEGRGGEPSAAVRERVLDRPRTSEATVRRATHGSTNAEVPGPALRSTHRVHRDGAAVVLDEVGRGRSDRPRGRPRAPGRLDAGRPRRPRPARCRRGFRRRGVAWRGVAVGGLEVERRARMRLSQLAEPGDERLGAELAKSSGSEVLARIEANDRTLRWG